LEHPHISLASPASWQVVGKSALDVLKKLLYPLPEHLFFARHVRLKRRTGWKKEKPAKAVTLTRRHTMQKITPYLWFDGQAEEAAQFYTSLFRDSEVGHVARYDKAAAEAAGRPENSAMIVAFQLAGQEFVGLNGGPHFKFTPAISFFVTLENETEIDALWEQLAAGGMPLMPLQAYDWSDKYGWVSDRYGLSWQIALGEREEVDQGITPSLLFVGKQHGRAEEAIRFYTTVFKNADIAGILHNAAQDHEPEGTVKHAQFNLEGQTFMAMDSSLAHDFTFNEALSFMVNCESQEEVDYYWDQLSAHPEAEQCGWLKDQFGLSWQIVPTILPKLLSDPDPDKSQRVMQAMLQMKKIDIATLERAYAQG
jgi:predicted 3-demethylubiquinone-9 3-methyltransferase (glyoxalase superfamily)